MLAQTPAMLFPLLLILVPAIFIVALARWAKTDEDDLVRKIVVSVVQLSCLMCMALGVMRFAQRSVNGAPPTEGEPIASGAPVAPSPPANQTMANGNGNPRVGPTEAERIVSQQKAEADRQSALAEQQERAAQQAEQNRRDVEESNRRIAAAQAAANAPAPPPASTDPGMPPIDNGRANPGTPPPTTDPPTATPPGG